MTIWVPEIADRRGPRYQAIADALAEDVSAGRLPPGTRLPPQRRLADRLGVNLTTVTRAYAAAEANGFVVGEVGRGTFVRAVPPVGDVPWPQAVGQGTDKDGPIDLASNFPCPVVEQARIAATFSAIAGRADAAELWRYHPESAFPAHRAAGAAWLARLGVEVPAERLLITCGALHGGFIALLALTRPGDKVLVEELTSPAIKGIANMLKLRLQGVAMDGDGIRPDALSDALADGPAKALYVVPNLQNPTLAVMPAARRREIAGIAEAAGLMIIEDDVYGLLLDDRPAPLAALAPARTCYVTSLSKTVAPGLRTGYLALPLALHAAALAALRVTVWMASPVLAQVASQWIADGTARHFTRLQQEETAARQKLAREILGGLEMRSHPAGLHLWLSLPEPWRAGEFSAALGQLGVAVTPSENFAVGRGLAPHAVRISLGAAPDRASLARGLQIVADTIAGEPTAITTVV